MNSAQAYTNGSTTSPLHMNQATGSLDRLGKLLVDNREISLWEHDTETLPGPARAWRRKARQFARTEIRPIAPAADLYPKDFEPATLFEKATQAGFLSMTLPWPLGSVHPLLFAKNPAFTVALVAEEFHAECGGLGLLLMAHNLGFASVLLSGHLPSYLQHLVPISLKNSWTSAPETLAFAITEPGAGSDVEETEGGATARLVTTATKTKGGYLLNGTKCFITGGAIADKIAVYAMIDKKGIETWTCFLVDKNAPGFSVGRREKKMGQRASDASVLHFDDVFVPDKNQIGKLHSGWPNNRNVLNYSRPVVGAMALGQGRGAFERALEFCRHNKLGNKRLIEYQSVQYELADMMISLASARALVWHSLSHFRCHQALSSAAKVAASDASFKVCNQAMELIGDHATLHATGIERSLRDVRLTQIYEGTNQINRLAVIEKQWHAEIANGDNNDSY